MGIAVFKPHAQLNFKVKVVVVLINNYLTLKKFDAKNCQPYDNFQNLMQQTYLYQKALSCDVHFKRSDKQTLSLDKSFQYPDLH